MKQKLNASQIAFSILLVILLVLVVFILWVLNVSGPARAYEAKIADQIEEIQTSHTAVGDIKRDVFRYVTYIGEDDTLYYWFSEEAQIITTREKTKRDDEGALQAYTDLGYSPTSISLGYGYDGPVYRAECDGTLILLDFDTLEVVFERDVMPDEG